MRKIAIFGTLIGLLAFAVSAQAVTYTPAPPPPTPQHTHRCLPHNAGYYATGTLVSATLTPVGNGRYNGTIEVNLSRANHHAPTGDQTFTLSAARVKFHHGVDPNALQEGSRVKLHGKITQLPKRCPTEGFTPEITVKKVDIRQPKHASG